MSERGRSVVFDLLERYCSRHGLRLTAGDSHGHAGCVENSAGKRWFFKGTRFDINPLGAAEIANDKAYSLHFLQKAGIRVPESLLVFSAEIPSGGQLPAALSGFVEAKGFPLFLKPNTGREGQDVMCVGNGTELENALQILTDTHAQWLIQREVKGRDLRVVVLDGAILCAIERKAPHVTGDGRLSIAALIDGHPKIVASDARIDAALTRQGVTRGSIPQAGDKIALLPVTNLSSGGTAEIITDQLGPDLVETARAATATLGLRYAGVDMIVPDGGWNTSGATVLEVNAAPGLNNLYRQGSHEAECVEAAYSKLFEILFEK
ncbi:MAG: ATP-dependent carboxylate-amine ligase [Pseudomonadota bacterium]